MEFLFLAISLVALVGALVGIHIDRKKAEDAVTTEIAIKKLAKWIATSKNDAAFVDLIRLLQRRRIELFFGAKEMEIPF